MKDTNNLKIGDRVTGTSLNGKPITGELVIIPRQDPSIGHVLVETGELPIAAKLAELKAATAEPKASAARPSAATRA